MLAELFKSHGLEADYGPLTLATGLIRAGQQPSVWVVAPDITGPPSGTLTVRASSWQIWRRTGAESANIWTTTNGAGWDPGTRPGVKMETSMAAQTALDQLRSELDMLVLTGHRPVSEAPPVRFFPQA